MAPPVRDILCLMTAMQPGVGEMTCTEMVHLWAETINKASTAISPENNEQRAGRMGEKEE